MDYMGYFKQYLSGKNHQPEWLKDVKDFDDLPRLVDDNWNNVLDAKGRQEFFDQFDHFITIKDYDENDEDIAATIWLIENLRGPWYSNSTGEFYFMEDADAMRFKLVWA